jgi:hypothetical protein
MAAEEVAPTQPHLQRPAVGADGESPTEMLSAAFEAAASGFRMGAAGDRPVMVAFALGWEMAEVYRPDRRSRSQPATGLDLPGVSNLSAGELQELGLFQVQAGITKMREAISAAGLEMPDAQRFADTVKNVDDPDARGQAIRDFHVRLLATLTAADYRLGRAYGLGRALADTTRVPPDWRAELAPYRVATVAGWIRELASALPPHAAHPVAQSLEAWCRWAQAQSGDGGETRRKLGAQGRLWRSLLSGEKRAVDVLETGDYLRAGEGMLQRTAVLAGRFLRHYWWLVLVAVGLLGVGVWLIVGPGNAVAAGLGGATIFASLGLSWKGIGTSLGTAAARVEEPLWQAELDEAIYERITPDEIVQSQRDHERGPDEPSLEAGAHEQEQSTGSATAEATASTATRPPPPSPEQPTAAT